MWVRGGREDRRAPAWEGEKEWLSECRGLLMVVVVGLLKVASGFWDLILSHSPSLTLA